MFVTCLVVALHNASPLCDSHPCVVVVVAVVVVWVCVRACVMLFVHRHLMSYTPYNDAGNHGAKCVCGEVVGVLPDTRRRVSRQP